MTCFRRGRHGRHVHSGSTAAYTVTARVLHWLTAALVLVQIPLGVVIANVEMGAWADTLYNLHKSIGATSFRSC